MDCASNQGQRSQSPGNLVWKDALTLQQDQGSCLRIQRRIDSSKSRSRHIRSGLPLRTTNGPIATASVQPRPPKLQFVTAQIGVKRRGRDCNISSLARAGHFSKFPITLEPSRSTCDPQRRAINQDSRGDDSHHQFSEHALQQKTTQHQQFIRNSRDLAYSGDLARPIETERIIGYFWEAYLPNSQSFPQGVMQITLGDSGFHSLSRESTILQKGLLALGLTTIGKKSKDPYVLRQGFRIYGEALSLVAKSAHKFSAEQLVATRLFSMYEV